MSKKSYHFLLLLVLLIIVEPLSVASQIESQYLENYYQDNLKTNQIGMYTLGTWAVGNIAIGAYGWSQSSGEAKYFHQMNTLWNTVNLGLAVGGLINGKKLPSNESDLIAHSVRLEKIFLINAGLDILYMGSGLLLYQNETNDPLRNHQFKGYGKSMVLQGAFLFIFDLAIYGIKKGQRKKYLDQISISPSNNSIGLKISFKW